MKKASLIALIVLLPTSALGVQDHTGPGILPTHLIAHVIFLAASLFIAIRLDREKSGSLKKIRNAGLLFALWNLITIVLHVISDAIMPAMNVPSIFSVRTAEELHLTHPIHFVQAAGNAVEHILMISALVLMIFALRELPKDVEGRWKT